MDDAAVLRARDDYVQRSYEAQQPKPSGMAATWAFRLSKAREFDALLRLPRELRWSAGRALYVCSACGKNYAISAVPDTGRGTVDSLACVCGHAALLTDYALDNAIEAV